MQTGATLDWQIFEEEEWDDAVAAGLIAYPQAAGAPLVGPEDAWRGWRARLAGVVTVVLVGILLGMAYPSWRAAGMGVSALTVEYPALVAETKELADNAAPSPVAEEALGAQLTMVTHYFQFEVYQRDSATVGEVAAHLDARYRELRRTLGLAAPASSLHITVVPHPLTPGWRQADNQLIIASPRFLPTSEASSQAQTTIDLLLQLLAQQALTEALAETPVRWQWNLMVDGLRLWLRKCHSTPTQSHCPALSAPTGDEAATTTPYRLTDLLFGDSDWFYASQQAGRGEAAASLIAYVSHDYGDETVASLLRAFGHHTTWQTLVPEVFGVPAEKFEQGWHEYLRQASGAALAGLPAEE